jgi:hypothetical protein
MVLFGASEWGAGRPGGDELPYQLPLSVLVTEDRKAGA